MEPPEDRDVVGSAAEPGRFADLDYRARLWRGALWARHRRAALAVGAAAVVAVGGLTAWQQAHPGPLPVPALAVSAAVEGAGFAGDGVVRVDLRLRVNAPDRYDEQVRFLRLTGPGLTSDPAQDLPATAEPGVSGTLAVEASVSCPAWTGNGLSAVFRVTLGSDSREVSVPFDGDLLDRPDAVVTGQCSGYREAHPLQVTGVSSIVVDPRRPVVRLDWNVFNPMSRSYTFGGETQRDVGSALLSLTADDTRVEIQPGANARISTQLTVTSCLSPALLEPAALGSVHLTVYLDQVEGGARRAQLDLPAEVLETVLPHLAEVCAGAPRLSDVAASITVAGTPGRLVATAEVRARVDGGGRWTAALSPRQWFPADANGPRLADLVAPVLAPGRLDVHGTWRLVGCDRAAVMLQQAILQVSLTGRRTYPYWVPVSFDVPARGCSRFVLS